MAFRDPTLDAAPPYDPEATLLAEEPQLPVPLPADEEPEEEEETPQPKPVNYNVRMSREDRRKFGRWLKDEIDEARDSIYDLLENLQDWRRDWSLYPWRGGTRWPDSADIPSPATRYACDAHHRSLNAAIVQADPPFIVEAQDMAAMDAAPQIEEGLAAKMEDAEWADVADLVHGELPKAGTSFLRVGYDWKFKRHPEHEVDWDESAFHALLMAGADPVTAQMAAVKKDARGADKLFLEFKDTLAYQGTVFKVVPLEDGVIFPTTIRDPEQARGIGERVRLTGWELKRGVEDGKYIREEVEEILRQSGDPQPEDREERLDTFAIDIPDSDGPLTQWEPLWRDYEFWDVELKWDANRDKKEEIVIATVHAETGRVIRIAYSPYEHGEFTLHMFRFGPEAGELFGNSTAQAVAAYQDAWSALLNSVTDHTDLLIAASATFFVDKAQSGFDPDKFIFAMGRPIEMRNPGQNMAPLPVSPIPAQVWQLLATYKEYIELVAGVSNPVLGRETETKKTLGEVQIVASQASQQFEEKAARISRQWARVWEQVRSNEAQFARGGVINFRRKGDPAALGQSPFGEIDAKTMLANVRLVPAGLRQISDMQSRISQAQSAYTVLTTNPLTANNPEIVRLALEELLRAFKYPPVDKVMAALDRGLQVQAQAVEQAAMGQMAALESGQVPPGGVPGSPEMGAGAEGMPQGPEMMQ